MTTAALILTTAAALMAACMVPSIVARLRDEAWEAEHTDSLPDATPEWLAVLAATEPSMAAHPAAGRIRDLIAANEAARIDEQWEAMNR